jgi:hypothetical protein
MSPVISPEALQQWLPIHEWLPKNHDQMDPTLVKTLLCPPKGNTDELTAAKLPVAVNQLKTMMIRVAELQSEEQKHMVINVSLTSFAVMLMHTYSGKTSNSFVSIRNHLFYIAMTKVINLGYASINSDGILFIFLPKLYTWFNNHCAEGILQTPLIWEESPSLEEEEAEEGMKQQCIMKQEEEKLEEERKKLKCTINLHEASKRRHDLHKTEQHKALSFLMKEEDEYMWGVDAFHDEPLLNEEENVVFEIEPDSVDQDDPLHIFNENNKGVSDMMNSIIGNPSEESGSETMNVETMHVTFDDNDSYDGEYYEITYGEYYDISDEDADDEDAGDSFGRDSAYDDIIINDTIYAANQ